MNEYSSIDNSKIQQWIADKSDSQKISDELRALGFNDENINAWLKEFKRVKYGKRQSYAFILLASGAMLGFVSCLLAIINPVPGLYHWFLYGLTSVAAVIIFAGLYLLFE